MAAAVYFADHPRAVPALDGCSDHLTDEFVPRYSVKLPITLQKLEVGAANTCKVNADERLVGPRNGLRRRRLERQGFIENQGAR